MPPGPRKATVLASASQPVRIGPIAWPTANTTVNTATAGPHAALGSDVLTRSVTDVGAVNIAPPKSNAERIIAGSDVLKSGIAAPTPMTTPAAASVFAGCHRARGHAMRSARPASPTEGPPCQRDIERRRPVRHHPRDHERHVGDIPDAEQEIASERCAKLVIGHRLLCAPLAGSSMRRAARMAEDGEQCRDAPDGKPRECATPRHPRSRAATEYPHPTAGSPLERRRNTRQSRSKRGGGDREIHCWRERRRR